MNTLIDLQNIYKDYDNFRALDDVSMTITPGVTGLLGPNGAGKSTLIKVLLGLVRLTSGTGTVLGHSIGGDIKQIRSKVGYMPEDDCYLHGLSGVESVQLAARLARLQPIEALRRAHEILDFCGAGQERYRDVHTYSTGMRQKMRFAQAIVHDPPFLILDEPTSGLDPDEREAMLNRIRLLADTHGKAVLLCTHILPDVQQVSENVIVMAAGKIRVQSSLEELSRPREPAQKVCYIGDGEPLIAELQSSGFTTRPARNERQAFWLLGEGDSSLPKLWELAGQLGISIREIQPAKNSIEEIFLDAIREGGQRADS